MNVELHHVGICVSSLEEARRFYCEVLGFQVEGEPRHLQGKEISKVVGMPGTILDVLWLSAGVIHIELLCYKSPPAPDGHDLQQNRPGITHIGLETDDIQFEYARLLAKGVKFSCPPQEIRPGVWATYFTAPGGVVFGLSQH